MRKHEFSRSDRIKSSWRNIRACEDNRMQFSRNLSKSLGASGTRRNPALLLVALFITALTANAEIGRLDLGARFDESGSQLTFRIYSSRAARIELYLYSRPGGAD